MLSMYSTKNYPQMSIAELEDRKQEMMDYMSKLTERYPKASGHPFTSDSEQLKNAQAERDAFHNAMLKINSEIWKRIHERPTLT